MNPRTLHTIHEGVAVFPAAMIPHLAFGTDKRLGSIKNELITDDYTKAFLLSCGHIIKKESELGGSCEVCLADAIEQGIPEPIWVSQVCREECVRRCAAPFCSRILCRKHSAQLPDGPDSYCLEHYELLIENLSLQNVALKHGQFASKSVSTWRSLFFDDPRLLK